MTAEGILCGWTEDGEPIYKPWPEVRDCGQCGAPAHWEHESSYEDSPMIICENGHYSSSEGFESVEEQAQYWNDRPLENALRARIAELEAQWASVPWAALAACHEASIPSTSDRYDGPWAIVRRWLIACHVKEHMEQR